VREPAPLPLRRGSEADLDTLHALVARAQFNERDLCARLKIDFIHEVDTRAVRVRLTAFDATDPQAILCRLYVLGTAVETALVDAALEPAEREALANVDLLRFDQDEKGAYAFCPVRLIPMSILGNRLTLVADRSHGIDWRPIKVPEDVVFPPQSFLTRQFLSVLPEPTEGALLDLCTGSGVAALLSGHALSRVVAVDVAARSVHFSAFNAWLNKAPQVEAQVGDLYAPVAEERFRWILAHPPYVPTLRPVALFRDGGELGDFVVRGILAGLPDRLDVDGTCYIVCMGADTAEGRFEENARRWMGEAGDAFDIVFAMSQPRTLENLAATLVEGIRDPAPDEEARQLALFREHGVSRFVHGALVLRRLPAGTRGETQRVKIHASTRASSFDWVFRWMAAGREPRFIERLMASTPKLVDGTTLEVSNIVEQGEFVPRGFRLGNSGVPFPAIIQADPWVVRLVMSLDGRRSLADALAGVRDAGHLPAGFSQVDADQVLRYLAERGIIEITLPD
jgi:hypothetical protein